MRPGRAGVAARPWSELEDGAFLVLLANFGPMWEHIAAVLGTGRSADAIRSHYEETMLSVRPPATSLLTKLSRTSVPLWWYGLAQRNLFYKLSPLAYGLAGLFMAYVNREFPQSFRYEWLIWVGQTILTYQSDVATLGTDSIWHALDRLYAYAFTIVRSTLSFAAFYYYGAYSQLQVGVLAVGLVIALTCIRLSWVAVMHGVKVGAKEGEWPHAAEGFFFWHGLWHYMLPLTAVTIGALQLAGYGADL